MHLQHYIATVGFAKPRFSKRAIIQETQNRIMKKLPYMTMLIKLLYKEAPFTIVF